jgi:Nif-specific regulatory protein
MLVEYRWPGNVRELENAIERLVVMSEKRVILPEEVRPVLSFSLESGNGETLSHSDVEPSLRQTVVSLEREQIIRALEKCGWIQARAARLLGLTPRQMGYRIVKYGIDSRPTKQTKS